MNPIKLTCVSLLWHFTAVTLSSVLFTREELLSRNHDNSDSNSILMTFSDFFGREEWAVRLA